MIRFKLLGAVAAAVVLGLMALPAPVRAQDAAAPVRLVAAGEAAPVLPNQPSCGPDDLPDTALRAFRRNDGSVVAFASAFESYPLTGPTLLRLAKACRSAYHSAKSADAARFDDETWIAATWTENGRDVMAIAHHEYHGEKHPGHCLGTTPRECRYGVLLHLISHDGGMTFRKTTPTPLAAAPVRQSVDQRRDTGFFQPSNIFEWNGYKHVFVRTSGGGAQPPATCIMRARDPLDPASWEIYDGASFRPALFNPYAGDPATRPVCAQVSRLNGLVWSALALRGGGLLALLTVLEPGTRRTRLATSVSTDLLHWSAPLPVEGVDLQWTDRCPTTPYLHYPSLVDPGSRRRNYDDSGSDALLFLTSIQIRDCKFTMNRTLVVMPVRLVAGATAGGKQPGGTQR